MKSPVRIGGLSPRCRIGKNDQRSRLATRMVETPATWNSRGRCDLEGRVDGIAAGTARTDGSRTPGWATLSVQCGAAAFDDVTVEQ